MRAATALSRAWVRLYTARMPEAVRDSRRAEVDADLWEHQHDLAGRATPGITASEIVLRTCLGACDDVAWRFEVLRTIRRGANSARITMLRFTAGQTRWMGLAGLTGGLLWAAYFLSLMLRSRGDFPAAWDPFVPMVVATLLLAGLVGFLGSYRERIGRKGTVGVSLLMVSMASYFLANTLLGALPAGVARNVFGVALGIGFTIVPIPGFVLVGLALTGTARAGAFLVAVVGPLGMVLWTLALNYGIVDPRSLRGDAPVNVTYGVYFMLAAGWLAAAGYSTYRQARTRVSADEPA